MLNAVCNTKAITTYDKQNVKLYLTFLGCLNMNIPILIHGFLTKLFLILSWGHGRLWYQK